jgi:methionyl aminopeptidase
MSRAVAPGVTTAALDEVAAAGLRRAGARSCTLGVPGQIRGSRFPAYTTISVNDEVVYGVPGGRALACGDLVTLDVDPVLDAWCASAAVTVGVGDVSPEVRRLIEAAAGALDLAIAAVRPGRQWSSIAAMIQAYAEQRGYGIVREYIGHGIGRRFNEAPGVLHYADPPTPQADFVLRPGMTLTIEPILTMGRRDVVMQPNGWTVTTDDGAPAAHFRHTIAVTRTGAEVLTAPLTEFTADSPPTPAVPRRGWLGRLFTR